MTHGEGYSTRDIVSRGNAADRLSLLLGNAWYWARAHARPLIRWKVQIAQINGIGAGSGRPQTVLVAGWHRTVAYYAQRFFKAMESPIILGTTPLLGLPAQLEELRGKYDLVIARVPGPSSRWLFDDFYLHVPEAVESRLELPAESLHLAQASTRARRNLARVRNSQLSWEISTDPADFDLFYDDYYVPFLRGRYEDLAQEFTKKDLLKIFRHGCIVWILKDGQRLVGALFSPDGDTLRWRVMGAAGDGQEIAKLGGISAIYVFGTECAIRYGFKWLDLGYSKASTRDGVLSHKASWGGMVRAPWRVDHDLLFGWKQLSVDVSRFLHETPLIVRDGCGLSAITALSDHEETTEETLESVSSAATVPGIQRVLVAGPFASSARSGSGRFGAVYQAVPPLASGDILGVASPSHCGSNSPPKGGDVPRRRGAAPEHGPA
jgi:hypothetical protein